MSLAVARPLLRQPVVRIVARNAARRFESTATTTTTSTTTKAAEAAKETASKAASSSAGAAAKATETAKETAAKAKEAATLYSAKAAQGLSRVTSAAGPAIAGAAKNLSGALGRVGGRTGRFIAFVERQVPWVVYYSRVAAELSRLVFRGQNMTPPPVATFQTYFQNAWNRLRNPSSLLTLTSPAAILQQVRNISTAQVAGAGVLLAEVLGFFTVGEMIGRFKLVGYHGESGAAHH